jgi:purine-binding chemotaxis protein CheW
MSDRKDTSQYLTFTLGGELFALGIDSVKEVLEHTKITKIPRTPPHLKGVIDLRGRAVPIVDMRLKFGMSQGEITVNTCLIIIEAACGLETPVHIGARVDSVREVIEMTGGDIESPPKMGLSVDTSFIHGMAKRGGDFVLILDVQNIFSDEDLAKTAADTNSEAQEEAVLLSPPVQENAATPLASL